MEKGEEGKFGECGGSDSKVTRAQVRGGSDTESGRMLSDASSALCRQVTNTRVSPSFLESILVFSIKSALVRKFRDSLVEFLNWRLIYRCLIAHVSSTEEPPWKGYFYMGLVTTAVVFQTTLMTNSDKMTQLIALRVKAALSNAVFRKSLRISHAAKIRGKAQLVQF